MMNVTEWLRWWTQSTGQVMARTTIHDSPLARRKGSVRKGSRGVLQDVLVHDGDAGLLVVDFDNDRVLLCDPDEIEPVFAR